ncbi:MAG: exodeoxyribonuclease VII small subunit [Chloroflexota bacterium]
MAANNNGSGSGKAHGENKASFEENFARLQEVVATLSEGNLTLQEALMSYEEGMALAERCGNMLDEAELRVKQVSERALRAGSASLTDLDEEIRGLNRKGDDGLIAIEIESFDTTLIFDDPTARKPQAPQEQPDNKKPPQRPQLPPLPDDLDPLFDDDD